MVNLNDSEMYFGRNLFMPSLVTLTILVNGCILSFLIFPGNIVIENCNPCAFWLISPCHSVNLLRSDVHVQVHLPRVV